MSTAKELLAMIEAVDPGDKQGLYEIDARTWCYVYGLTYEPHIYEDKYNFIAVQRDGKKIMSDVFGRQYTKSRDALVTIRPKGWFCFSSLLVPSMRFVGYAFHGSNEATIEHPFLPSEELAELHAVLQAIAYERGEG